ncbi:hypothetical protein [Campylobacter cuniculorum]|uniref:Uncharacterized protein n=2 Tax=Campylobacter cuniculorum TaxID=374106 RepID=A0A1W6BW15_9BACT|nr:hypothetical protein [Campylobacter cuniculorum]ARJ56250.1 hypothetical protein CCUN_0618 [Campylobacter cuniculorum DSM 23162 = LMG 24588]QOR03740.1 acyl carrier protein [Campylobacter cuniculorum]
MKAFLHIGTTNTGNQEKQGFLMQNQELLLQKGYCYAKSLRVANRHWALVDMVLELVNKTHLSKNVLNDLQNIRLKEAVRTFEKEREEHKDKIFIFSAEGVVWDFSSKRHFEILKSIMENLGFDEIKCIVYFREITSYFNSHCSQDIKNNMGFYSADFTPDKHPRKWIFDYRGICENVTSYFGTNNLIVRLLREDYVGGNMISDFLHHLGIAWDESFKPAKTKNESFSLLGMEIMKRLNQKAQNEPNFNSILYFSRKIFEGSNEDRLRFNAPKDLARAYEEYYAPALEWVRERYFPHKKTLFSPIDWENYKENYTLKDIKSYDFDKIVDFMVQIIDSKNTIIKNALRNKP